MISNLRVFFTLISKLLPFFSNTQSFEVFCLLLGLNYLFILTPK